MQTKQQTSSEHWKKLVSSNPVKWHKLTQPRLTPYIPTAPHPKQAAFLLLNNEEAFYGGAAGGGKSEALLMAALQYVDVPGYAALLLRRTFPQLSQPGSLLDRARSWLGGTDAVGTDGDKTWTFPSGATLTFGHMQHEKDKYEYQSAEFQYIGFDELTGFTETQYRYLFSRLRRKEGVAIPLRMRSASNPGNEGHDWVKQRFIVEGRAKGRPFLPAKLQDNPSVDREGYKKSLINLDPVEQARLLAGDWDVRQEGGKFKSEWFEIVEAVPKGAEYVRFWDLAATEPKEAKDPD